MFNKSLEYVKAILIIVSGLLIFLSAPFLTALALKWYEDTKHYIIVDGVKVYAISDRFELFLWAFGLWAIIILLTLTLYVSIYEAKRIQKSGHKLVDLVIFFVAISTFVVLLAYGSMFMNFSSSDYLAESIAIVVSCFISVLGGIACYRAIKRIYNLTITDYSS